jgi:hypothetical protein
MSDEELIARLRDWPYQGETMANAAADRIEALVKERDQHLNSFVHWHKQADDLTGQLVAARQDADEAEAYAWELEQRLSICEKHRDAYAECDRIGTQAVRDLEAKLAKAAEMLEAALKYNSAMHGGAGAYNKRIKDTLAEIKGGKDAESNL